MTDTQTMLDPCPLCGRCDATTETQLEEPARSAALTAEFWMGVGAGLLVGLMLALIAVLVGVAATL